MIDWREAKTERPGDKQSCFITVERGLISAPIIGPIVYMTDGDMFMDICATPEAGACYPVEKHDLWWCDDGDINLPPPDSKDSA